MGLIKSNTYKSGPLEWPQDVALYFRESKASWMQARRILYQSMTGADIALLELNATYRELTRLGIDSYEISSEPGKPGDLIFMRKVSSPQIQSCAIEKVIPRLKVRPWEWLRTYRYTACKTHNGDSGAPLISAATGKVIGVHDIQA